jgi:Ca2+-binding EF-hand superfamily protein
MDDGAKKKRLEKEFKKLDKDKSGYLEAAEVKQWLRNQARGIELTLSDRDVKSLIAVVDKNGMKNSTVYQNSISNFRKN